MFKKTIFFFLLIGLCANAQEQYYELRDFVTDSAYIFTPEQEMDLNQRLVDFETATTNQLVIVTIEQLGYETIETYANGLFNQNGIGQEGKDNGLLILFSELDREVRIEVGYGLEPYITDAVASRIIRNTMIPNFKEEAYFNGIDHATNQLIEFLNDPEALEEFKQEIADEHDKEKLYMNIFLGVFLSIFMGVGGFFFFRSYQNVIEVFRGVFIGKLGVLPGIFMLLGGSISTLFGMVFMVIPLFIAYSIYTSDQDMVMHIFDEPKLLLWLLLPFFGIAAIIAFIKLKITGKDKLSISWLKNDKTYYRKTFSSSGSHSFGSGSRSSGGSSSSFSGGGGSSGGGGASGSW
ncbi:TPM domain-containing protein [Maribacter confluentis]|uniref:TPM domain-containing protein n=1 Tax=Maribacter confluentis TaxID=1656093 RepID=A0ABT8RQ52_9FLAO|nr:TPM domain-containing protein [Maribacter confluentis]MDO1512489.1 TPM domain-containing protein [Maribacter confluentis]